MAIFGSIPETETKEENGFKRALSFYILKGVIC